MSTLIYEQCLWHYKFMDRMDNVEQAAKKFLAERGWDKLRPREGFSKISAVGG
jgi:hypothetical protein